jgi:hypothetical protein
MIGYLLFLGAYLVGNNWDYRLTVLVLCLPQLDRWRIAGGRSGVTATAATLCLLTAMYLGPILFFAVGVRLDEFVNWYLLYALSVLAAQVLQDQATETGGRLIPRSWCVLPSTRAATSTSDQR